MEITEILSRNVNRIRLSRRLTMQNLADLSGTTSVLVSNFELNKWKNCTKHTIGPGLITVEKLSKAFGISVASLLTDDTTMVTQGADFVTQMYLSLSRADRLKMHKLINILF